MTFWLRFLAVFGRAEEGDPQAALFRLFVLLWFGGGACLVAAMALHW